MVGRGRESERELGRERELAVERERDDKAVVKYL